MSIYGNKADRFEDEVSELMRQAGISGIDVVEILLEQAAKYVDEWLPSEPNESGRGSVRHMASIIRDAKEKFTREYENPRAAASALLEEEAACR